MGLVRNERGAAFQLALMAVVILGALAAALLSVGGSEVRIASNHVLGTQGHFLAEAGIEDAFNYFRANPAQVSSAPASSTQLATLSGPGSTLSASGSYTVQYQRAGSNTVLVVATGTTGTGVGGAQRVLRATMTTAFSSDDAVRTRQNLTISGNPSIFGTCGGAHANGDFTISGNPVVSNAATATGTYSASGNPSTGPGSGGGMPAEQVPTIDPAAFLAAAKVRVSAGAIPANQVLQMKSDGQVLDGNDTLITTLASGQEYNGWKYEVTKWTLHGNTGYTGTYYLEGDVVVSGNPGSSSTPWNTSIIATGDIEITGNPEITTHLTDTLFVAGEDVKINGNPNQTFNGLIAAHEQFSISGNPTINGYIIADDAATTSGTVTENRISGNATITFNCNLNPPLAGTLRILSWGR